MPNAPKKPQDHKPKAAKRLQAEAVDPMDSLLGREITVAGRLGEVTVTVLDDPMDWDADVSEILAGWGKAGGIIVAEVVPLLKRIVSLEDGHKIDQVRPTQRTAHDLIELLTGDGEADSPGEELGESQAS